ncbi:unnamed protein product [Brachionus calyciflorus]|uniref:Uncharacterized protein n=1 Tax=Brachionus calyciflorus TaxID=104777 RepID=A0A814BNJ0_9BILA|nr:unnamed protein product [Brachionus calyciflorus]
MSGNLYSYDNTINLILFADGVIYDKSGCNSIWSLMSSIAELPPLFIGEYNNEINGIIQNGMEWSDMTLK